VMRKFGWKSFTDSSKPSAQGDSAPGEIEVAP
jgi:hypothetical protein